MSDKLPDFIIAGAQKCGTTTLHHILNAHPQIYIPADEIFFFDIDDIEQHYDFFIREGEQWYYYDYDQYFDAYFAWYKAFFASAPDGAVIGEDSTTYVASPLAAQRIATVLPDVKIIISLRDPVKRAYSHYWHLVKARSTMFTFEETLRRMPNLLLGRGHYKEQLERYYDVFPREQVFVLWFEDFLNDKATTIGRILDFLGIEEPIAPDVLDTYVNKTYYPRNLSVQLLYNRLVHSVARRRYHMKKHLPRPTGEYTKPVDASQANSRMSRLVSLAKQVDSMLTTTAAGAKPPMNPETEAALRHYFDEHNAGLESLIAGEE